MDNTPIIFMIHVTKLRFINNAGSSELFIGQTITAIIILNNFLRQRTNKRALREKLWLSFGVHEKLRDL